MLESDRSYIISGKKIVKLIELIEDLRDIASDYAEETGYGYAIADDFDKLYTDV